MDRNYLQSGAFYLRWIPDVPRLTEEHLAHMVRLRDVRRKVPVRVRLDAEVLDWLRGKGEGHLTRIDDILTNLREAERRAGSGK